ncbi:putative threonine synthase [Leptomonas seymouri]|uniref:Putative threonine synthase n=1 Tax=Leptomonas seymouri TaxID=5684 RepID=A0A0N1HZJ2_LEPSE|nr:putative threonine synthase [Leptomonas seymouri]|eukprot:KPI83505.1 putative threonine synthase [Leptomonas seymouri]
MHVQMFCLSIIGSGSKELKAEVQTALVDTFHLFVSPSSPEASPVFTLCLDTADAAVMKPLYHTYHYRFVWTDASTIEELVAALRPLLESYARRHASKDHHVAGCFTSTRGAAETSSFLSVVRDGLASDGGLYILKSIPMMPFSQIYQFCKQKSLSYVDAAEMILEQLVDASITPAMLYPLVLQAYDPSRWSGKTDICPVTPLLMEGLTRKAGSEGAAATAKSDAGPLSCSPSFNAPERWTANVSVLELFHGPTAAFKDFALQLFPRYFGTATATATQSREKYIILAATSGDTGVAAISGFVNAGARSQVMVLYPSHGVSPVQQMQMLSFDDSTQVRTYAVHSDFDFCQNTVKKLFSNEPLKEELAALDPAVRLSSANSINWGRLIPQVVYYFWAYRHHVQHPPVGWTFGDPIDVVVPCGNFGNILSGYVAKRMGLPVRKLIVASNCNDVLCDFVMTGTYDVRQRTLAATASPSIDILKASNVERFLYLLSHGDTELVARLMKELDANGVFTLPDEMRAAMQESFTAGRCSEEDCAATIKSVYDLSHGARLLDPHTAVAVFVAKQFREAELLERDLSKPTANDADGDVPPLVILSTAHWAKFPAPVLHSLRGEGAQLSAPASSIADGIREVRALYTEITKDGIQQPHPALLHALDVAEKAANAVRSIDASVPEIQKELEGFARV